MPLAIRFRDETPAGLAKLPGLEITVETDASLLAALQGRSPREIGGRFTDGHRAYVARVNGDPAGWGWVATKSAEIGELSSSFSIPEGNRYLWNFETLPSHRGKGIYPRLVDAIVHAESHEADRFWIAYAPENHASGSGVRKAGFTIVAEISFDASGNPAIRSLHEPGGTEAAQLLNLPLASEELAPCWHCTRKARHGEEKCGSGECTCDYQKLRAQRVA